MEIQFLKQRACITPTKTLVVFITSPHTAFQPWLDGSHQVSRTYFRAYTSSYRFPLLPRTVKHQERQSVEKEAPLQLQSNSFAAKNEMFTLCLLIEYESEEKAKEVLNSHENWHQSGNAGEYSIEVLFFALRIRETIEQGIPEAFYHTFVTGILPLQRSEDVDPVDTKNSITTKSRGPEDQPATLECASIGQLPSDLPQTQDTEAVLKVPPIGSAVLILNPPPSVPFDSFFILFGLYGDVLRMKRLENVNTFKDSRSSEYCIIVQYDSPLRAATATEKLQSCLLEDTNLELQIWEGPSLTFFESSGNPRSPVCSCYEYTTVPQERHRYDLNPNHQRLSQYLQPPSKVLFLVNMSPLIQDDVIVSLFLRAGFQVMDFYRITPYTAQVFFDNVGVAVQALISLHDTIIEGTKRLAIMFAKRH